jgi:hypothetical protein
MRGLYDNFLASNCQARRPHPNLAASFLAFSARCISFRSAKFALT